MNLFHELSQAAPNAQVIGQTTELIAYIALTFLMFTVLLSFIRLRKGPSLPDRVIALDLLTSPRAKVSVRLETPV